MSWWIVKVSLSGPGTVYVTSYFGPRSPAGRLSSIGSGRCAKTAGKNPVDSDRFIVGVPGSQQPLNVIPPPPSPGPVITASDGPLPSAAAGSTSEATASVRIRRFIGTPFVAASTPAGAAAFLGFSVALELDVYGIAGGDAGGFADLPVHAEHELPAVRG